MKYIKNNWIWIVCLIAVIGVGSFIGHTYVVNADNMQVKVGDLIVEIPGEYVAADVTSFLNIRYQPSADSVIIGKLYPGDMVKKIEEVGDWTKIDVDGQVGYISTKYTVSGANLKKYVKNHLGNLCVSATQTKEAFQTVYEKKKMAKLDVSTYTMGGITAKNTSLYVTKSSSATIKNQYETVTKYMVTANALRFRERPSLNGTVYNCLYKGDVLDIVSEKNQKWLKVKIDGKKGYVSRDYVASVDVKVEKSNILKRVKAKENFYVKELYKNWVKVQYHGEELFIPRKNIQVTPQYWDAQGVAGYIEHSKYCDVLDVQEDIVFVNLSDGTQGYTKAENLKAKILLSNIKLDQDAIKKAQASLSSIADANVSEARKAIVEEAMKYVGYPYKWGGNSLTEGVDCSGFTQQIFMKFGVNLSRCSYMQVDDGKEISFTDLKPGDLVFYYDNDLGRIGHVAIYMGDNKVVHAKSSKSGITVSAWNYRTPYAAANVLGD